MKEQIDGFLNLIDVDKIVDDVVVDHPLPTITWNHGKVLAVNGTTLMTGGINYISVYSDNQNLDICDHSVKVKGDAAVSAHRFLDYFWKYEILSCCRTEVN
jgi:phosphatidylserine/phosphatidylglycerophosphate/cardiolipin synthase-like enzyme